MDIIGEVEFSYDEATSAYSYEWNFGEKSLEEFLIFNSLGNTYTACTEEIKFQTGVLASTKHYLKFFVTGNGEVYAKICLGATQFNENEQFTDCAIHRSTITLFVNERNSTTVLRFEELEQDEINTLALKKICKPDEVRSRIHNQAIVFWYRSTKSRSNFWGYCYSKKDIIRRQKYIRNLTFKLEFFHRFWHKDALKTETSTKNYGTQQGRQNAGKLDTKSYFNSKEFSDFVVECEGKKFPVHRIILASKSPVFAQMFQQPLKEKEEGRLVIEDCEPRAVEEFLKFLYTGEAKLEEHAAALFIISDKYCVDELKTITEKILVNKVNEVNFLELFTLGNLLSSNSLTTKCQQMFKSKKNELIKTSEDIKRFSEEYPDLMLKFTRGEL